MDCIFCRIAAGQIPAKMVFEDSQVVAFRDINPQAPVHVVIIPRKHVERVSSLTEGDLALVGAIHRAAQKIAIAEKLERGFRLVTNNGEDGSQTVPHLHYHLLGGRMMGWPPG